MADPVILAHCQISRCETEPGYCTDHLDDASFVQLSLIVFIPIVLSVSAPLLPQRSGRRFYDDDLANYGEQWKSQVDPPMFLCGIGLLPLDCGLSGLLTVVTIMVSAFVIVFYVLLLNEHPCSTGLGKCRTISCICGNVYSEGYVFMFCSLALTSLLLVQRISSMFHHMRPQHRIAKAVLILGALMLTLTGIFPERYDRNEQETDGYATMYRAHIIGVMGSSALLLCAPFAWFFNHWRTHRGEVPLLSLAARSLYFLGVVAFSIATFVAEVDVDDFVNDYCTYINNRKECDGWPLLEPGNCSAAEACLGLGGASPTPAESALCEAVVQPNFLCTWRETDLSLWTRTVAPKDYWQGASCIKAECPLYYYARGVALEFAVLLLTLTYVSSFGLHDVRRLLNRPPGADTSPEALLPNPINVVPLDASGLQPP